MSRFSDGGFEHRFDVFRTDGKPCRANARYMVMDGGGDDPHATKAIRAYAESVRSENPKLAEELISMLVPGQWPVELAQHADAK